MKPDPKLAAFYADLEADKQADERSTVDRSSESPAETIDRHRRRKHWTGLPYTRTKKKDLDSLAIVPGYPIEGTHWTALEVPRRVQRGRYPKKYVLCRCACGNVRDLRLDTLTQRKPGTDEVISQWCRSCSTRHQRQQQKERKLTST